MTRRLEAGASSRAHVPCTGVLPVFLAGGINPENVQQAIEVVHPYGIDLSSGVEFAPGRKDPEKLRRLVLAARGAVSRDS